MVVSYWQDLNNIHYDFIGSNKTKEKIVEYLNSQILLQNQYTLENVFKI